MCTNTWASNSKTTDSTCCTIPIENVFLHCISPYYIYIYTLRARYELMRTIHRRASSKAQRADLLDTVSGNRIEPNEYTSLARAATATHTLCEIRIENHFFDSVRVIHFGRMGRKTHSIQSSSGLRIFIHEKQKKNNKQTRHTEIVGNAYSFVQLKCLVWNWKIRRLLGKQYWPKTQVKQKNKQHIGKDLFNSLQRMCYEFVCLCFCLVRWFSPKNNTLLFVYDELM